LREIGVLEMPRMKKILFALCALVLLGWVGGAVENSFAGSLHHSHKPVFSQPNGDAHHDKSAGSGKFYCPMHKHRSLMPCPHKHSQKEMAHPGQCKIGVDCGGSPFKSIPAPTGFNTNPILMTDNSLPNLPEIATAISLSRVAYDNPPTTFQKHPPKSL